MGNETSSTDGKASHLTLLESRPAISHSFSLSWESKKNSRIHPEGRGGHTFLHFFDSYFLLFGGGTPDTQFNDLWIYSESENLWVPIQTNGNLPSPRTGAAVGIINNVLWVFGGLSFNEESDEEPFRNDLHSISLKKLATSLSQKTLSSLINKGSLEIPKVSNFTWTAHSTQKLTVPSVRDKMAVHVTDGKMYIFGGFGPEPHEEEEEENFGGEQSVGFKWFNDFYIFEPNPSNPLQFSFKLVSTTGNMPSGRASATGQVIDYVYPTNPLELSAPTKTEKRFYLFGGKSATARVSELHFLNLATNEWNAIEPLGRHPVGRSAHLMTSIGEKLIVFGGNEKRDSIYLADIHIYDSKNNCWCQIPTTGLSPTPRRFHSGAVSPKSQKLLIFGGEDPSISFNELWQLDTSNVSFWENNKPSAKNIIPSLTEENTDISF